MPTKIIFSGASRSFPDGPPQLGGAGQLFAGAGAGAAYAASGDRSDESFVAIELAHECLGEHLGLDEDQAHRRTVGFARFRLGDAAPSQLIELVRLPWTEDAAVASARAAFEGAGFVVAECADTPGRIVNRLVRPYFNAVLRRLDDGLASAADMDKTLRLGLGYPEGPIALLERTGLADHHDAAAALYAMTADPDHAPARRARIAAARVAK
jgi:3-hydroxybutyryl-CoA dehydrogenase